MSLTALGLTQEHEALYRKVLDVASRPGAVDVPAGVERLATGHPEGPRLLADLRELGLLGGATGCEVKPPSVLEDLAERVADDLAARQRAVARARAEIADLTRSFACHGVEAGPGVEFLPDREQVRARIDELSFFARHSILSVQAVARRDRAPASTSSREDERALRRGLDVRVVVDHPVAPVPGTQIRVADAVLQRLIIIDSEVAVVAAAGTGGGGLVIRQRGVVTLLNSYGELLWAAAAEPRPGPTDAERELLELLRDGVTDDAMARALGISSRQARRRVAVLMTTLGVTNRFAAGVEAARRGWT